ncbi:mucin-7 [Hyaena hyaena]|uniref:mucin-7 n=1 Tax=Hyaena hyaena TaxID=95912 RepID=UPI001920A22B|nr:mucin-7 [Hyaena hyaena]
MKTLTLLVCVCALSACFSVSEGHKKPWKTYHKKNIVRQRVTYHQLPFHPKPQPNWNILLQKHLLFNPHRYQKPSHPIKRKPMSKPKCPVKTNTVVNSNTAGATTQIPSLSPTFTSNKITESPGVTSFVQNPTTITEDINTGSSSATTSPQPSTAPPDTTAAPSSPAPPDTTAAPPTSSPAPPDTTVAPSSPAPPDTTAAPPTSSLTTLAPEPSSTPLETTAPPNTTPNPSPTSLSPETSETTAALTTQTTTPAAIQTTTVGQTTSPFTQNQNNTFWEHIYEILKYIYGFIPNK